MKNKGKTVSFTTDNGENKTEKVRDLEIDCGEYYPGNDALSGYCSVYINEFEVDQGKNIKVID